MADPIVNTQFTSGTVITADWLNGVNDFVNQFDSTYPPFQTVTNIAELRTADKTKTQFLFAKGYYTAGDGGGGFYRYDSTDTTTADNGGTVIVSTDGGRWKLILFSNTVSVKQFGAKGDVGTDDTAAIQAAIDNVPGYLNTNGATIWFPPGSYRIEGQLVLPDIQFITLAGSGYVSRLFKVGAGSILTWENPGAGLLIVSFHTIRDLAFDGNTGTEHIIDTANCSSLTIKDVYLERIPASKAGIMVRGNGADYSHDVNIDGCYITSTTGDSGVIFGSTSADSRLSNFWMNGQFTVSYCLNIQAGAGQIQVSDSHFYNAAINVVFIDGNGGNIGFTNCIIDNATGDTVYLLNTNGVTFNGGKIMFSKGATSDVILDNSVNCRFVGVEFEGINGAYAVREINASNNNSVLGCEVRGGYTNTPPFLIIGAASTVQNVNGMNPLGYFSAFSACTVGTVPSATTTYLGTNAQQSTEDDALFIAPRNGVIRDLIVQSQQTPGGGQTYTFTVRKAFVDTSVTAQITDGNFNATGNGPVSFNKGDVLSIKCVTSATATASRFRLTLNMEY